MAAQGLSTHQEERAALVAAVRSLFVNGVMSSTGHGDVSQRINEDEMLLTVPGRLRELKADELALVRLDGRVVEGEIDPLKAEIATLHAEIYRLRPDIRVIIHTHSASVLAFALANRPLPCRYEAMRFGQPSEVPVVPWARRGTPGWIEGIVSGLAARPDTRALILGNHGVLVFGPDPAATVTLATVLEEAAAGELAADRLGGALAIPLGAETAAGGTGTAVRP
jgi:L-fuculose-phosphate aldolase